MSDLPDWRTIPEAERRRLLVDFCAQGLTSSQIANSFHNCSRSAAIGKLQRLGLKLNGRPAGRGGGRPKDGAPARTPRAPVAPKPAKRKQSPRTEETTSWRGSSNPHYNDIKGRAEMRAASPGLPVHLVTGEARKPIDTGVPVSRNLKLTELTERTCKWPHGDPLTADFGFCGNDSTEIGPYCRYHSRIASAPALHRLSVPKGA